MMVFRYDLGNGLELLNARGEPRPEAGVRHERTLETVSSRSWLGAPGFWVILLLAALISLRML